MAFVGTILDERVFWTLKLDRNWHHNPFFCDDVTKGKARNVVDDDDNHDNTKPHPFILMARETLDNNLLITYVVNNRNHAAASINKNK